jgi:hypothetical protein
MIGEGYKASQVVVINVKLKIKVKSFLWFN